MQAAFDCIVVGAGFAGAVAARELAERGNWRPAGQRRSADPPIRPPYFSHRRQAGLSLALPIYPVVGLPTPGSGRGLRSADAGTV